MAEQTSGGRAREATERGYGVDFRVTAAAVVLVIFVGLAYPVSIDQIEGGALILYAGVILGCALNAALRRSTA
jgi:hypothetical protein